MSAGWPEGATPDGLVYELEVSHNMDANLRVVDGITTAEPDYRHETAPMDWHFVNGPAELPDLGEGFHGTYAEMSAKAVELNDTYKRIHGERRFNFYPTPALLAAA